jgi:hypothetical protein
MHTPPAARLAALTVLLAATVTGGITGGASASTAGYQRTVRGCAASWRIVTAPTPPGSNALTGAPVPGGSDAAFSPEASLSSASVTSGKDAWFGGLTLNQFLPWILRWNGRSVSQARPPIPEGSFSSSLGWSDTVTAFDSRTDGWSLGADLNTEPSVSFAEHWHGAHWVMTPMAVSPAPVTKGVQAFGLAALSPGDAWAVGALYNPRIVIPFTPVGALIEHWNGTSWVISPNPASSRAFTALLAVTAVSPDDVWTVGYQAHGSGYAPIAEHFDGARWGIVPNPPLSAGERFGLLSSVSATSSGDVWVGGYQVPNGVTGHAVPLAEHWNGATWRVQKLPALPRFSKTSARVGITSIYAASAGDVWAVPNRGAGNLAVFLHWDGKRWGTVPVPGPQEYGLQYSWNAVSGDGPANVWAAGDVYNQVYSTDIPQLAHLACWRPGRT